MKVEKVSSNTYRVRKTYNGTRHDIYFNHEPDEIEVMEVVLDKMKQGDMGAIKGTFEDACKKYIASKQNVLSPSTVGGYNKLVRVLSKEIKSKPLHDITQLDIQNEINNYAIGHSPKSVRNLHGFISAVLGVFVPSLNISTTLPQKKRFARNMPTTEDVRKILEASEGTPYHIAFQLAVLGMRRSEICGATIDDIKGNMLTINKARIYDGDNHLMTRDNTKTEESTREIYLPDALVAEIRKTGVIYDKTPPMLVKTLHKYQDELGIPRFRLHDLRGFYVSYAHSIGIPDVYILKSGGWKSDFVMKNTYRDALRGKTEEMQKKVVDGLFS